MRTINLLKRITILSVMALIAVMGTSQIANAQGNRRDEQKQQQREAKQRAKDLKAAQKAEAERARAEQQRQSQWNDRNTRMNNDRVERDRRNGNYNNTNVITVQSNRYRVYRNGAYYNTDNRGADLLREAVNEGYRQGFAAGRRDRSNNRRSSWNNSNIYNSGTMGYQSYVDRNQYRYYFQQGFQRGYQDGSNRQYANDYDGDYQYGTNRNGSVSILGAILGTILNIQNY